LQGSHNSHPQPLCAPTQEFPGYTVCILHLAADRAALKNTHPGLSESRCPSRGRLRHYRQQELNKPTPLLSMFVTVFCTEQKSY